VATSPQTAEPTGAGAVDQSAVSAFIALIACAASVVIALTLHASWVAISSEPGSFATFFVLTVILQVIVVDVYGRGTVSFAGMGLLAIGIMFGAGPAAMTGVVCGVVLLVRMHSPLHRGVFNMANFALSSASGSLAYHLVESPHDGTVLRLGPAVLAGAAYCVVNVGFVSLAMSLAEGLHPFAVWTERFRWFTPYYLVSGPLALALVDAYEGVGLTGMLAFTLPPAMLLLSMRQYVHRTAQSVEDVRAANAELRRSNTDLEDLFGFAAGLAARTHDRNALTWYVQDSLEQLVGARVTLTSTAEGTATPIELSGRIVGGLLIEGGDAERWARLREAIMPQLATALESTLLVEEVRKTHLDTIAALSRSMSAKDYYTGGHTERVSDLAVALAQRLGYNGPNLDAVEIGALLHDIGKIGIPEQILHKAGPLSDDEWIVLKKHPVISEYILAEIDLPRIVLEIARHSHERIDGRGYPDGLAGEEIPLPARIVLVADAFDALTSDRPYRPARTPLAALTEIRENAGTQFCPHVVEALEHVFRHEPGVLGAGAGLVAVA
jgi:putative nucleotidyltransferase with HDIG domain